MWNGPTPEPSEVIHTARVLRDLPLTSGVAASRFAVEIPLAVRAPHMTATVCGGRAGNVVECAAGPHKDAGVLALGDYVLAVSGTFSISTTARSSSRRPRGT